MLFAKGGQHTTSSRACHTLRLFASFQVCFLMGDAIIPYPSWSGTSALMRSGALGKFSKFPKGQMQQFLYQILFFIYKQAPRKIHGK